MRTVGGCPVLLAQYRLDSPAVAMKAYSHLRAGRCTTSQQPPPVTAVATPVQHANAAVAANQLNELQQGTRQYIAMLNNQGIAQLHQHHSTSMALRYFRSAFEQLKASFFFDVGTVARHDGLASVPAGLFADAPRNRAAVGYEALQRILMASRQTLHQAQAQSSAAAAAGATHARYGGPAAASTGIDSHAPETLMESSVIPPQHTSVYAHGFAMLPHHLMASNPTHDVQIRSAVIIYNLALVMHIESLGCVAGPGGQNAAAVNAQGHHLLQRAHSLYLHAYRLLYGLIFPQLPPRQQDEHRLHCSVCGTHQGCPCCVAATQSTTAPLHPVGAGDSLTDLLYMAVLNNLAHVQRRLTASHSIPFARSPAFVAHMELVRFARYVQQTSDIYNDARTAAIMKQHIDAFLLIAATRDLEPTIAAAAA